MTVLDELLTIPAAATPATRSDPSVAATVPDVESSRQALHDVLTMHTPSAASLDDWERSVWRYGRATKDRPPSVLLADLLTDFDAMVPIMAACRSSVGLRRLTRVAAQLAGLVCLTLIKLDDRTAFRRWARTARVAATEVDDPATHAWVLAQEAYGHFYARDFHEAVSVAEHAQTMLATDSSATGDVTGGVLAAALEARAHASLGRADASRVALRHAEGLLQHVEQHSTATAFGYDEAQPRFHESNALTHLGDVTAAWSAQDRALELVAPGDYMDRSLTVLDRALCLLRSGDPTAAMALERDCLLALSEDHRRGIITGRASLLWPAAGVTRSLYLKELYVRDSYRRRGVGTLLMDELRRVGKTLGCSRLEWTTDTGNEAALAFYAALGVAGNDSKIMYREALDQRGQ